MHCRQLASLFFVILLVLPSMSLVALSDAPTITGYVTSTAVSGSFAVQGTAVHLTPSTVLTLKRGSSLTATLSLGPLYLGEKLDVYGRFDKKMKALMAERVVVVVLSPGPIHGTAIVDLVPSLGLATTERVVRADGYLLRLTSKSRATFHDPLKSVDDLKTNLWVTYQGVQQNDGTVRVETATFSENTVKHTEDNLREKTEYDPSVVDPNKQQSGVSKAFLGVDPRRIPPYNDPAMQARVTKIGESLIPAFQRALPDSDATKIDFRFHLIDSKKYRDAVSLPSGIILVPRQVVERLQNDSQLAEVLADNIAEVLEKHTIRIVPANNKLAAAQVAGAVGGIFVPGLGIATGMAAGSVGAHLVTLELQQSGRVSLFLMKDAGYDVGQAPLAWWLLASKKPIEKTKMPPRAANLYMALGTTWAEAQRSVDVGDVNRNGASNP